METNLLEKYPLLQDVYDTDHTFKIGYGPNALINMASYRACIHLCKQIAELKKPHHIKVFLYKELARSWKETRVINDIKRGLSPTKLPCKVYTDKKLSKPTNENLIFDVVVFSKSNKQLAKYTIVSTGAGSYSINGVPEKIMNYREPFVRSLEWLNLHPKETYLDYLCFDYDTKMARTHYDKCIQIMDKLINEGLKATKPSPDLTKLGIVYKPRAKIIYENVRPHETTEQRMIRKISAYAFAISETIPLEGKLMVASPTGSTAPVVWAVLRYLREEFKPSKDTIHQALAAASLIYNNIRFVVPLSSFEGGCQSSMAAATAMATAITCVILYNAKYGEIGRACEMAMEHTFGLICNSVCAVPLVPCVQRTASFAVRAYELAVLNHSLMATEPLVRFDDAALVLASTGKDLGEQWKVAGFGGFAETARYSLFPNKTKKGGK